MALQCVPYTLVWIVLLVFTYTIMFLTKAGLLDLNEGQVGTYL